MPGAGSGISSVLFTIGRTIALLSDSKTKTPSAEVLSAPIITFAAGSSVTVAEVGCVAITVEMSVSGGR